MYNLIDMQTGEVIATTESHADAVALLPVYQAIYYDIAIQY